MRFTKSDIILLSIVALGIGLVIVGASMDEDFGAHVSGNFSPPAPSASQRQQKSVPVRALVTSAPVYVATPPSSATDNSSASARIATGTIAPQLSPPPRKNNNQTRDAESFWGGQ